MGRLVPAPQRHAPSPLPHFPPPTPPRSPRQLAGRPVGVFVGCIWSEYGELLEAHGATLRGRGQVVTGNGLVGARLAHALLTP